MSYFATTWIVGTLFCFLKLVKLLPLRKLFLSASNEKVSKVFKQKTQHVDLRKLRGHRQKLRHQHEVLQLLSRPLGGHHRRFPGSLLLDSVWWNKVQQVVHLVKPFRGNYEKSRFLKYPLDLSQQHLGRKGSLVQKNLSSGSVVGLDGRSMFKQFVEGA